MSVFTKARAIIFQEPENKNESAKTAVVLRISCIAFMLYLIMLGVISVCSGNGCGLALGLLFLAVYALVFAGTYQDRIHRAFVVFNVGTVAWVVLTFISYGEAAGSHHFILALILLDLLLERRHPAWIITGLYMVRVFLYVYSLWWEPLIRPEGGMMVYLYTLSLMLEYVTVLFSGIYFTKDAFQMEARLQEYNEELRHAASTDPLTKVWNRFRMLEHVQRRLKKYKKGELLFMSVAIGDIDFFKHVNDTYGHECGDEVLKRLARLFDEETHTCGAVARWGGEEFLFLFENMNGDEAWQALSQIQLKLNKLEIPYEDHVLHVTMTFGLSEYDFKRTLDENIKLADDKLYQGKEGGRNRIVY